MILLCLFQTGSRFWVWIFSSCFLLHYETIIFFLCSVLKYTVWTICYAFSGPVHQTSLPSKPSNLWSKNPLTSSSITISVLAKTPIFWEKAQNQLTPYFLDALKSIPHYHNNQVSHYYLSKVSSHQGMQLKPICGWGVTIQKNEAFWNRELTFSERWRVHTAYSKR